MDEKINRIEKIALTMSRHLIGIFQDEEDRMPVPRIVINDENATDVFIAFVLAAKSALGVISPDVRQEDLIGFVGLMSRLALQYLLEFGEVDTQAEI